MPNALARKGVIIALKQFADDINNTGKINISVTSTSNELNVAKEDEIHIYRVVQEAIHNTIKHAQAARMNIDFKQVPGEIQFTIQRQWRRATITTRTVKNSLGLGSERISSAGWKCSTGKYLLIRALEKVPYIRS
jgi:signal transduction histidine kinase